MRGGQRPGAAGPGVRASERGDAAQAGKRRRAQQRGGTVTSLPSLRGWTGAESVAARRGAAEVEPSASRAALPLLWAPRWL